MKSDPDGERHARDTWLGKQIQKLVVNVRRVTARLRLVARPTAFADALRWQLLSQLDVTSNNVSGPPRFGRIQSQACSAAQILDPAYREWAALLGDHVRFHRKQWEHITILEAARQAAVLSPGKTALGFGVGTEPLPAALASFGLSVIATDQEPMSAGHWAEGGQHALSLESLTKPHILNTAEFQRRVTFRTVDMNDLPRDLGVHDLIWSSCAMEHLGSPQAGLDFVVATLGLLRPGGLSVHTTELDLTPQEVPVDYGHCALYRPEDMEELRRRVVARGLVMDLNFYVALDHPADRAVAPPLSIGDEEFHLKLALHDSITTSFALVIRRPAIGIGQPNRSG